MAVRTKLAPFLFETFEADPRVTYQKVAMGPDGSGCVRRLEVDHIVTRVASFAGFSSVVDSLVEAEAWMAGIEQALTE